MESGRRGAHPTPSCRPSWVPRLEQLETRLAPVVGAFGIANPVLPGTGFDGVAAVIHPNAPGGAPCTGSLLFTGRHILTAAHCADINGDRIVDPGNYSVVFQLPGPQMDVIAIPAANIRLNPNWRGDVRRGSDLALLTLPRNPQGNPERYQLYNQQNEVGQNFTIVGYGLTGWGAVGSTCGALCGLGTKRSAQNRYDALDNVLTIPGFPAGTPIPIRGAQGFPQNSGLVYDFDSGMAANDALGRYAAIANVGLGNDEGKAANGDSGGPGFIGDRIASVVSYGFALPGPPPVGPDALPGHNHSFGEVVVDTRVSQFVNWINNVVNPPRPQPRARFGFNNRLSSDILGAPDLISVDPLGRNAFETAIVYGESRPVFQFDGDADPADLQAGLTLNTTDVIPADYYSIEVVFEFLEEPGFRRVLDVQDRQADEGFYVNPENVLQVFPEPGGMTSFTANVFHHVVLTNAYGEVNVYLDGALEFTLEQTELVNIGPDGWMHFFLDNLFGRGLGEYSDGRIALLQLYEGVLTPEEVALRAEDPFAIPPDSLLSKPREEGTGGPSWKATTDIVGALLDGS
jgi:hypothetical protein